MPRASPFIIRLTSDQEAKLKEVARKYTSPYCDVVRAKAILYAAEYGQKIRHLIYGEEY